MSAASFQSGSARVPRVGDGVAPSRTFLEAQTGGSRYSGRRLPHFERPWEKGNDDNGNIVFGPLRELMHSIKSFSAHKINDFESKSGSLWEKERFDRYVRSDRDLQEKNHYILRNPWDSGVAKQNQDYPWVWTQDDERRKESSFRRDAETSTRDACATQRRET